ncbi:hypothetical protein [Novosphingobium terrae]|uniref:hypothetical protein n=1 Tax=Novosphingobium terrae TaxID=2726189 RepID=UPI001980E9E7|nr:hypothetical protein [Novosphingobium terrae]
MTETITRLFDTPDLARQAAEELERAAVPHAAISILSPGQERDVILDALTRAGVAQDEARSFAEAVGSGGSVVSVSVEKDRMAAACAALDSVPFINLQPRRVSYQVSGESHAVDGATPPSEQDITHDRAR